MIVDIEKVVVKNRIRKDFGDIQELADDIKANGLINPPVVNKEYVLLAGERRLKACKLLGWKQVEIRMMDTRDAEHELNVEISENENRKEFSKAERVDYMKRLMRIEQAKAKERQGERNDLSGTSDKYLPEVERADTRTAKQFNVSRETMRKELSIVENKELLSPEEFAEWDEGKLSTNKAYQKIKAEIRDLKEERDYLAYQLEEEHKKGAEVKEVVKEVVPDDYEELKQKAKLSDDYRKESKDMRDLYMEMAEKWKTAEREKEKLINKSKEPEAEQAENIKRSALFFCAGVSNFIENYGGYVWLTEHINEMEAAERKGYLSAINAVESWVFQMKENMKGDTK